MSYRSYRTNFYFRPGPCSGVAAHKSACGRSGSGQRFFLGDQIRGHEVDHGGGAAQDGGEVERGEGVVGGSGHGGDFVVWELIAWTIVSANHFL